jgi:uncharacterized membrane protein
MTDCRNTKQALGTFSSQQEAEDALSELRDAGFAMNQVSIIAKCADHLDQTETTHVEEGAKTGAVAGTAVGELAGLLIGLGTLAIPGVGPIILAGATATAIVSTLAGGAIGAAAGGLAGSLIGLGIPEDRAQVYHDSVVNGEYLVIVDGREAEILEAETILKRRGIREWEVYTLSSTPGGSGAWSLDPAVH